MSLIIDVYSIIFSNIVEMESIVCSDAQEMLPSLPRRQRLDPKQRRNLLLRQGIELCEAGSWREVTPQAVAARAGISAGLLYHYFPSRTRFQRQVLDELIRSLEPGDRMPSGASIDEAVRSLAMARVSLARTRPGAYRAIHAAAADPELSASLHALRQREVRYLLDAIGRDTPELRVRLQGWLGFCEAAALHWLEQPEVSESELVGLLAGAFEPLRARADTRRKPRVRLVRSD
jgi:AcrR family transcriptional regulator